MSNLGLRRCLASHKIEFVEVPVGDRYVIEELEARNLSLGGEQSGHIVFPDHASTGDGTLTGALLLDVVNGTGHSLSLLAGGGFLVFADVIARTVISPAELPIGVVTAFVGAPFFAIVLRSARRMR